MFVLLWQVSAPYCISAVFSALEGKSSKGQQHCSEDLLDGTGKADSNSSIGYEGLWRAHIKGTLPGGGAGEPQARPPVPPEGYGSSLSTSDMEGVARFLEGFAVRALLPHLEIRLRNLNHQVSKMSEKKHGKWEIKVVFGASMHEIMYLVASSRCIMLKTERKLDGVRVSIQYCNTAWICNKMAERVSFMMLYGMTRFGSQLQPLLLLLRSHASNCLLNTTKLNLPCAPASAVAFQTHLTVTISATDNNSYCHCYCCRYGY